MNVGGYQDEIERDSNLHFIPAGGAFQVTLNSSTGDTPIANVPSNVAGNNSSNVHSQYQLPGYHPINGIQSCPYQQPLQFSHIHAVSSYPTLGQVLTGNNEQTTFPNFINFLRYQNSPIQGPSTSHNITCSSKNARSFKYPGANKRQESKQNKTRSEGNKLLSTRATYVLEGWYEANTEWPYPSKAEKQVMASAGGITVEQVTASLNSLNSVRLCH